MDELAALDGVGQGELVASGQVSALELVDAAIERIERLNPTLNAVITPMFDRAREAAERPAQAVGPLAGVPFLLKDLLAAYAGARMTEGSVLLRDFVPGRDSELVRRLKRAGLIFVGKTNTPEFGILGTTEPQLFGPTRNPWDPQRMTGGSSGGSAAAVAAGMVPMAHANDGGGSIRIPAACCGVFGLKPTRARNPLGPDHGDLMSGLVAEHAVTRSVRDSAALLDATCGPDLGDPYWSPPGPPSFRSEAEREPGKLRIAMSAESPTGTVVHPDCERAVQDAAQLCRQLGHDVEEARARLDPERLGDAFDVVWSSGIAFQLAQWSRIVGRDPAPDQVEPLTWALYEKGRSLDPVDYLRAVEDMQRMSRIVARFLEEFDVWLTPTVASPPLTLGWFDPAPDDPLRAYRRDAEFCPFTPIANITGQPAMSVPLYWNDEGLPVGVHFAGRFGDEVTLLRLATQLEEARPWTTRIPPVSAMAAGGRKENGVGGLPSRPG